MTQHYMISISFFDNQQNLIRGTHWTTFAATGTPEYHHISKVAEDMKKQWCESANRPVSGVFYQINCCDFLGDA